MSNPLYDVNATTLGVHYTKLVFPSTFNLLGASSQKMFLPDESLQSKSFVAVTNFNDLSTNPLLVDLTNHKLIPVVQNGGTFKALVPNSGGNKICYFASSAMIDTVIGIFPVNGTGQFVNYSTMSGDSSFLIVTNKLL